MKLPTITDARIERMVSVLLRAGVVISGLVVLFGGMYFLARHGREIADHHTFHGEPGVDRIVGQIIAGAVAGRARSLIQLGLLLLIATPIARVAFSLVAFMLERDRTYVVITAIVLTILLYSLVSGAVEG
jgi:uncharacterized membrane protein